MAAPSHTHADAASHPDCPACLVPPPTNRSAKIAWTVAGVAVTLLILVFFLGVGSRPSTLLAGGGFALAALLVCPLTMGGMMWYMMRNQHKQPMSGSHSEASAATMYACPMHPSVKQAGPGTCSKCGMALVRT